MKIILINILSKDNDLTTQLNNDYNVSSNNLLFNILSNTNENNLDVVFKNILKKYNNTNDKKYMKKIYNIINESETPILYLGQGANGLSKEIKYFIENANIPVTTTIHALGLVDQNNPLSLKWLGMQVTHQLIMLFKNLIVLSV